MNYRKIYINIITHARSQNRFKGDGNYYESHHILPKSMFPLWKSRKSNIVLLTAREHFFCHQLLAKIYPTSQMLCALHAFVSRPNSDYKVTSREYERIRIAFSNYMKTQHYMLGRKLSKESIEKIKIARARQTAEGRTNKGLKWTPEQKANLSKSVRAIMTPEHIKYIKEKTREKCAKKVRCIETGEVFDCISDIKLWLGDNVQVANIVSAIKGRHHYAYVHPQTGEKLHWEYC